MGNTNIPAFFLGLMLVLHFFFVMGVFSAARDLRTWGEAVIFAPPIVWALLTLLWGMFAPVPYWLIHHSGLRTARQGG